jgi:hypothetical protein
MARKLKIKIPKRVAGIKIPKTVRKGPLIHFLNSSAGQVLLAEGLMVLGGALGLRSADPDSGMGHLARHPLDSLRHLGLEASTRADGAGAAVSHESKKLSVAFSEAIRAFRAAMDEATPEDGEAAQDPEEATAGEGVATPERAKKKQPSSRPDTQSTPH